MDKSLQPELSPVQHVCIMCNSFQKGPFQSIEGSGSENEDGSHLSSSEADTDQIDPHSDSCISDLSLISLLIHLKDAILIPVLTNKTHSIYNQS